MLNNVVDYWANIQGTYIWVAYISGRLIFGGGLIFGMRWALVYVVGKYSGGGLYSGGGGL
jgi:hypothetical protein